MPAVAKLAPEPIAYTIRDIAAKMQVSRTKAYYMVTSRSIPGVVRIDGCLRIDRKAFDQWWEEQVEEGL